MPRTPRTSRISFARRAAPALAPAALALLFLTAPLGLLVVTSVAAQTAAQAPGAADLLSRGDAAWARRAEGRRGAQAAAGPIDEAIAAYERSGAKRLLLTHRPKELPPPDAELAYDRLELDV
ncbi:MAG TPA: hypothetical protein VEG34_05050 [Thermoanaerobaculia bacterium]|nr:hypothetical protein [Thermoanaerobaculia bacterium]